jgi:dolichol-phosphate mannosyltransferase
LASIYSALKYIDFSRKFGHQIAVTAGLDACIGDKIVIIDADIQDPPELIGDVYAKMQEGFEVVYAKRRTRKGESFLKRYIAQLFYRTLASITSISIPVDTGDFRMINRKIVGVLKNMSTIDANEAMVDEKTLAPYLDKRIDSVGNIYVYN